MSDAPSDPPAMPASTGEFAARLASRLCHDFISPASAIISGLDLLEDPNSKDLQAEALSLIASSAKKLVDMLTFARAAYGGSASLETFESGQLEALARNVFDHVRPELDWAIAPQTFDKTTANPVFDASTNQYCPAEGPATHSTALGIDDYGAVSGSPAGHDGLLDVFGSSAKFALLTSDQAFATGTTAAAGYSFGATATAPWGTIASWCFSRIVTPTFQEHNFATALAALIRLMISRSSSASSRSRVLMESRAAASPRHQTRKMTSSEYRK